MRWVPAEGGRRWQDGRVPAPQRLTFDPVRARAGRALAATREAVAVLAPVWCAACEQPGRALCAECRADIRSSLAPRVTPVPLGDTGEIGEIGEIGESGEIRETSAADDRAHPILVTAAPYGGALAHLIGAYKEAGRLDAARPLAAVLRVALALAVQRSTALPGRDGAPGLERAPRRSESPHRATIVTAPSSPAAVRRRGHRHLDDLVRLAAGVRVHPGHLRHTRRVADQAGLNRASRAANLAGAMRASAALAGRDIVIVDDVVTSGATVREAVRAVQQVGGRVVGVAAIARA